MRLLWLILELVFRLVMKQWWTEWLFPWASWDSQKFCFPGENISWGMHSAKNGYRAYNKSKKVPRKRTLVLQLWNWASPVGFVCALSNIHRGRNCLDTYLNGKLLTAYSRWSPSTASSNHSLTMSRLPYFFQSYSDQLQMKQIPSIRNNNFYSCLWDPGALNCSPLIALEESTSEEPVSVLCFNRTQFRNKWD